MYNHVITEVAANILRDKHRVLANDGQWYTTTLLEMSRTNAWTLPRTLDDAAWGPTGVSVTANATVAPDGNTTAEKLVEDSANVTGRRLARATGAHTAGAVTLSVYLKAGERSWVALGEAASGSVRRTFFNIAAGTVGTKDAAHTASVRALANGWYRCEITYTSPGTSHAARLEITTGDGVTAYTGDGASGLFAWHMQHEIGAFATSPIPPAANPRAVETASYAIPDLMQPAAINGMVAVYTDHIEAGTAFSVVAPAARLWHAGRADNTGARWYVARTADGRYRAVWFDAGGVERASTMVGVTGGAVTMGDRVRSACVLDDTGRVRLVQKINNAAAVDAGWSAANTLPAAWGAGALLHLNGRGSSDVGRAAYNASGIVDSNGKAQVLSFVRVPAGLTAEQIIDYCAKVHNYNLEAA